MGQTTIIDETIDSFNSETGEILQQHKHKVMKSKVEPTDEFIKVSRYLNTVFAYNNIPLNLVGISLLLAQRMEFKTNIVYLLKSDKVEIGEMLGFKMRGSKGEINTNTVDKLIKELKNYDIIRPTDTRGKYMVNAFLFSTGSIAETRNLQAMFNFEKDAYWVQGDQRNLITGETVRKSVTNKKPSNQISGQMRLCLEDGSIEEED